MRTIGIRYFVAGIVVGALVAGGLGSVSAQHEGFGYDDGYELERNLLLQEQNRILEQHRLDQQLYRHLQQNPC